MLGIHFSFLPFFSIELYTFIKCMISLICEFWWKYFIPIGSLYMTPVSVPLHVTPPILVSYFLNLLTRATCSSVLVQELTFCYISWEGF